MKGKSFIALTQEDTIRRGISIIVLIFNITHYNTLLYNLTDGIFLRLTLSQQGYFCLIKAEGRMFTTPPPRYDFSLEIRECDTCP